MSKLFMYGTSLEGIEQLMLIVPNFSPRRSGIVINNYFNCKGGVKDCNCNVISVSNRCNSCECIHSDILSNVDNVGYKDLVKERFYNALHKQDLDVYDISRRKSMKKHRFLIL